MSAPCHTDTCSISWSTSANTYVATVNLKEDGGLTCVDGQGLAIDLGAGGNCFQDLTLTDGQFGITSAGTTVYTATGAQVGIPNASNADSSPSLAFDAYNPFNCDALLLVTGVHQIDYNVIKSTIGGTRAGGALAGGTTGSAATDLYPFNANINIDFTVTGLAGQLLSINSNADIGGVCYIAASDNYQRKNWRDNFARIFAIDANAAVTIEAKARQNGFQQLLNFTAAATGTGFRTVIQFAFLPIGAAVG